MLLHAPVVSGQPLSRDAVAVAADVCDLRMSHGKEILHQAVHSVRISGEDRRAVIRQVIDRDYLNVAAKQLRNLRVIVIEAADNCHSVKPAVLCPFHIGHVRACTVQKGYIISSRLCRLFEALQHSGKKIMCQTASGCVFEQYANVVASICFQISGRLIGEISHLLCRLFHQLSGLLTDVPVIA